MKIVIVLVSIMIITGVLAQGKSGQSKGKSEVNIGQDKSPQKKKNDHHDDDHGHDKKKSHKEDNNHGNGHAYGKDKHGMSGKEFGQYRAYEARSKSKKVKTHEEARFIITTCVKQTSVLILGISFKLTDARIILTQKLEKRELSQAQFDIKLKLLMGFDKRHGQIQMKIKG
jgi:colicin import membrane protein